MYTCVIRYFPAELDDVAAHVGLKRCVCRRCYARETGSERPMSQGLRQQIATALDERTVAEDQRHAHTRRRGGQGRAVADGKSHRSAIEPGTWT